MSAATLLPHILDVPHTNPRLEDAKGVIGEVAIEEGYPLCVVTGLAHRHFPMGDTEILWASRRANGELFSVTVVDLKVARGDNEAYAFDDDGSPHVIMRSQLPYIPEVQQNLPALKGMVQIAGRRLKRYKLTRMVTLQFVDERLNQPLGMALLETTYDDTRTHNYASVPAREALRHRHSHWRYTKEGISYPIMGCPKGTHG